MRLLLLIAIIPILSCNSSVSSTSNTETLQLQIDIYPPSLSSESYIARVLLKDTSSDSVEFYNLEAIINDSILLEYSAKESSKYNSFAFVTKSGDSLTLSSNDVVNVSLEDPLFGQLRYETTFPDSVESFSISPAFDTMNINTKTQYSLSWDLIDNGSPICGIRRAGLDTIIRSALSYRLNDTATTYTFKDSDFIDFSGSVYPYVELYIKTGKKLLIDGFNSYSHMTLDHKSELTISNIKK